MDRSGRRFEHTTARRWIGIIHPFPLPGDGPRRISAGPGSYVSARELRRRSPAMLKLITRHLWRLDFLGHVTPLCDLRRIQADLDLCIRFHHTPENSSGPGYRDPVENRRGDSVQSPEYPAGRMCRPGKATLNLGKFNVASTQVGSGPVWLIRTTSVFSFSVFMAVGSGTCPGVKVV